MATVVMGRGRAAVRAERRSGGPRSSWCSRCGSAHGDAGFQLSSAHHRQAHRLGAHGWARPMRGWHNGQIPAWLAESLGVSLAAEAATLPVVLLAFGRLAPVAPLVNASLLSRSCPGDGRICPGPDGRLAQHRRPALRHCRH